MKIGLLHYTAPPIVGGVEAILGKHALLMLEAGHQVDIIAGRGSRFDPRLTFHHVPIVDSIQEEVLSRKAELDQGVVTAQFEELIQRITYVLDPLLRDLDLLIAHNVCSLHKNLALSAALRRYADKTDRSGLILWHHDFAWSTPRYREELHDGYPWDLIREDWPRTIQVAVSDFRRREMANLFQLQENQIRVVPNGIDIPKLLALSAETKKLVRDLQLLSAAPLILLPVRITRRKNIELAIRVVADLKKHFSNVMLVVTGPPGPHNVTNQQYFATLKELRDQLSLNGQVHFLAELSSDRFSEEDIFGLYRLADLLLLPSLEEGFGLPVIESSQTRLPIFCSDIEPLRELGKDEVKYFSPQATPEEIAAKIEKYLQESNSYRIRKRLSSYEWNGVYENSIAPLLREAGGVSQ